MLRTRSVRPSQIGPRALSFAANVQSSIKAARIASLPPARGRGRLGPVRTIDEGKWVEHLKEKDEGGDMQPLGKTLTTQLDHERGEHQSLALGPRRKVFQHARPVDDIGVGEQQIIRT